jgi:sulfur-oxidizing protein SoxZ
MSKTPRVKVPSSAKAGDLIEIKTLASHDMETGNRKDKDGKPIPRLIINDFSCKFNGKEVFGASMHPAVSANPYIAFFVKAEASGTFEFTWTDDNGDVTTVTADMQVA